MFYRYLVQIPTLTLGFLSVGIIASASPLLPHFRNSSLGQPIPSAKSVPAPSNPSQPTTATPLKASLPTVVLPSITGATISGSDHIIRIAGNGMSLTHLAIGLPQQMENFSGVTIQDQSGANVPVKVSRQDGSVDIDFDTPVPAGSSLEVHLNNVQMRTKGGERLPYQITVTQTGAKGNISIGTALINVPNRD